MKLRYIFATIAAVAALSACNADMDYDIVAPILSKPDASSIQASLQGDNYVISWPAGNQNMQVTRYANGTKSGTEVVTGGTYTHYAVETNVANSYVLKYTDGTNFSEGVVLNYTRPGAARFSGIQMSQLEKVGGYDAYVEWNPNPTATTTHFVATNGADRTINETLMANVTNYTIKDVVQGETWTVTLTAENNEGRSLPTTSSLRIGKTAIGYLSVFDTPEELVANGDDDDASAWLWFHETYPTGTFVPFSSITSADVLEPYRVLWWMRDLDDNSSVWEMPEVVMNATPAVRQWYKDGGSLLLWAHATPYIGTLGRLDMDMLKNNDNAINTAPGGYNPDVWKMACMLNCGGFVKDYSTHAVFRGLEVEDNGTTKLIAFKGAGWTEDHNCLFFNIPSALTGLGNQDEASLTMLNNKFGIYPLGTWDSQIWWVSQLNVWEAQQGDTDFQGTVICVGNGGLNFSMKNDDGTPDISAHPHNNAFQENILTFAKNALEYLKTR